MVYYEHAIVNTYMSVMLQNYYDNICTPFLRIVQNRLCRKATKHI